MTVAIANETECALAHDKNDVPLCDFRRPHDPPSKIRSSSEKDDHWRDDLVVGYLCFTFFKRDKDEDDAARSSRNNRSVELLATFFCIWNITLRLVRDTCRGG